MFDLLQKIGKALMTPIAVLPVAALLLRLGFGDIFDGEIALVAKSAGEAIFGNLDMLFGVGIAYGLAKNSDGVAALSGALSVIVIKAVYLAIDKDLNLGIFVGIIAGVIAGSLYNRFHTIRLPDYLGFFSGKRFVAIVVAFASIVAGVFLGYFWHYAQDGIDSFSNFITNLGEIGTFIYGTLNRLLIPLGLHHILNSVFWFQLGDYHYLKDGVDMVANGDLHRFFAGDKSAGVYMAGFYVVMMFGLPSLALAIYFTTPKEYRKKAGALLLGVAFTSFLTGVTEPLEFMFMFVAPMLYLIHALLTGLALAIAQALDIHAGFGFSAGFIDYVINYKLSTNGWMIIPLGLVFGVIYFAITYTIIKKFKLSIIQTELQEANTKEDTSDEIKAFIDALGGVENIKETTACITRLRMTLKDNKNITDEAFIKLGAKGVIKPNDTSLQVVLGAKAEVIADGIKAYIKNLDENNPIS
jgi:PTS system N-acetylglucosamine-specific IIC component